MCTIDNIKNIAKYLNVKPGELFYNNELVSINSLYCILKF